MSTQVTAAASDSLWDGGRSPYLTNSKKFGMWLFIISDALTFSALLFAYTYSRVSNPRLADAVPLLAEHHLLERDDLRAAHQQLDDGDGRARHESRQPRRGREMDAGHDGRRARPSSACTSRSG